MNTINQIRLSKNDFIVETEKSLLKLNYKNEEDKYIIDITSMNLINAVRIAILCSTYCYINDFKKKLCWVVADDEIKRAISILCLKNVEQSICKNNFKKHSKESVALAI